jgi:DsbC/DsbD-like thiol-disulfide interchange protein
MKMILGVLALVSLATPSLAQRQMSMCMESATAKVTPARVAPGGKGVLTITIEMKGDYHIYDPKPGDPIAIPTSFTPQPAPGVTYGAPAFPKPTLFHGKTRIHEGIIVIRVPVTLAKSAKGKLNLGGGLKVQACNETGCLPPFTVKLSAPLTVGK